MIYDHLLERVKNHQKLFALLIDPENIRANELETVVKLADQNRVDFIFVGGSLISEKIDHSVKHIKSLTKIPVLLFPGSLLQISGYADGILLLSLISGRNPEYLIGNHVQAAPLLKKLNLEIIPTAYVLAGNAEQTAVGYLSHTYPIPFHKTDLLTATAMAGEMLGNRLLYLEAGSGATQSLPSAAIKAVKDSITIPLIVGGGITTSSEVETTYRAGADIIVMGNSIEKDPGLMREVASVKLGI